jgi:tripartite-type tricarboxylate transporter receptor subunit TctC
MNKILSVMLLTILLSINIAHAEWLPEKNKTVAVISGHGPGGTTHLVATWFENFLSSKGIPAFVDVKQGAKGQIATAHLTQQQPNGYSVLMTLGLGMMVHPDDASNISKKHSYKDFELITIVGKVPSFLVTRTENSIKNINQLTSSPRKKISIAYSTETQEILAKTLAKTLNHDVVIVPYKNNSDVMRDLLGGIIDYAISTQASSGPYIQQGKMVAIATTASGTNIPEFDSKINPLGKDFGALIGLVAPKGTPDHILKFYTELSKEFIKTHKSKFNEVHLNYTDSMFGQKEFLRELMLLESLL